MTRNKIILIIATGILVLAVFGVFFTLQDKEKQPAVVEGIIPEQNFDFVKEDKPSDTTEYFNSFGLGKLKINTYGGPSDIKVALKGSTKYALIRNPRETGDLEMAISNEFGEYYFAENADGEKIVFEGGSVDGRFGYLETGEVSQVLIQERIPSAEYYAAYPESELALKTGFEAVGDTGIANRFLSGKYLKIKNLNNNKEVIVEIDTRNTIEDSLLVSEATQKALGLDKNSLGSFSLELVSKENNTLGVVRN